MGIIQMGQQELKSYRLGMDVIEGKLSIVDFAWKMMAKTSHSNDI
jgi:hypothetical protein